MVSIVLASAVVVSLGVLLYLVYQIHYATMQGGSWYNDLQMSDDRTDNYWNRLQVTLTDRINVWRWAAFTAAASVVSFVVTYIFVTGLVEILR